MNRHNSHSIHLYINRESDVRIRSPTDVCPDESKFVKERKKKVRKALEGLKLTGNDDLAMESVSINCF